MYAYKAIFPGNSIISCYEHICAWINYIKVVDLRKSDYRHNFRCKCGFCQGLSQFQECVCCSEIDCCLWSLKTMKRLRQKDSFYLHNTSGIPSSFLESLGSSDSLVLMQTAVLRLLRRPNTQTNRHIA